MLLNVPVTTLPSICPPYSALTMFPSLHDQPTSQAAKSARVRTVILLPVGASARRGGNSR